MTNDRFNARHYRTGDMLTFTVVNGVIASVTPDGGAPYRDAEVVAPAMFDLQINGCLGRAFVSPTLTSDDVRVTAGTLMRRGVSGFCPTLITASRAALRHGFRTIADACDRDPELSRAMPCFHLEGPYLSPLDGPRGAHPREHVRQADFDEFRDLQDAAGGRIRLVTLAPEVPGALALIAKLASMGVVVAIGHTAATPEQIRAGVDAGATLSTHLGNGCASMIPRHENHLWEQLADDRLSASIIPDGHHLPDAMLRVMTRAKGVSRLVTTCDASSLAGLPPGSYDMWGSTLEVLPSGKVVVPGTAYLAGSGLFTDDCVAHLVSRGICPLADALDTAGANPRRLLGLPPLTLSVGDPADLIFFDADGVRPRSVMIAGRTLPPPL